MSHADRLRLKDMRAAYRLIGECRDLGHDHHAWRLRLLEGLQALTGSQLALYMQIHDVRTPSERLAEPLAVGLLDASQRALWAHYQSERAHEDDPFHQGYFSAFTGALKTRRLDSVVNVRQWRRSRHYNEYIRACGLGDRITSSLRLAKESQGAIQVIVLHRAACDGDYSRRTARLVHLFHHELSTLLGGKLQLPDPGGSQLTLPTQLRHVLTALLQGACEKEIARRLGLSRHTVNRHVQRLYRRFGVHCRGELTFLCRNMLPQLDVNLTPAGEKRNRL